MIEAIKKKLISSVDIAPLVTFRVAFGLLLLIDVYRYFSHSWIHSSYVSPTFHFTYYGFSWIEVLPGTGMYYLFALLGVCSLFIILGLFYRISIIVFTLGFTYVFLIDQTNYLNHFYLVILYSVILIFLPANRDISLDSKFYPKIKTRLVPYWTVLVLILQLEIVLIYAGVVKINSDWLQFEPLRMWLFQQDPWHEAFKHDWIVILAIYFPIAIHILGAPLLFWKKTRLFIFVLYVLFHLSNHFSFRIGIFPWFTIAATTLFFSAALHRKFWNRVLYVHEKENILTPQYSTSKNLSYGLLVFFTAWFIAQTLLPIRHYFYPGDVDWNEDGHHFSWRMKLRSKKGTSDFKVEDSISKQIVKINIGEYLTYKQYRKISCHPELILQFSRYLAEVYKNKGFQDPKVFADIYCSLNGRALSKVVANDVDLSKIPQNISPTKWMLPLNIPLEQRLPKYQYMLNEYYGVEKY
jgi:hypothetical protein